MRNKIIAIAAAVVLFLVFTAIIGCQNAGEKNNQITQDSIMQIKPDSLADQNTVSDDWLKFKTESEIKIKDNEENISAFKEKMKKAGTGIKAKYNEEVANLEEENRKMKKKLEEYKNDGKTTWSDFKTGFNKDMDKIGKAVKDLTSDND
jgi:hypothetical protein